MNWIQLILGIVMLLVSVLLRPKPKQPTKYAQDIKAPQASAGIPIPVVFGSITIKSPNALYFGHAFHLERDSYKDVSGK